MAADSSSGAGRFEQEGLDAVLAAAGGVARHARRRQQQDRRLRPPGQRRQGARGIEAVHARHGEIEHDAVDRARLGSSRTRPAPRAPLACATTSQPQRSNRRPRMAWLVALSSMHMMVRPASEGARWSVAAAAGGRCRGCRAAHRQRQPDRERAALADHAVDGDAAAHQVDQAARDRQSQAGAAEAPGGRAVGLAKGGEDRLPAGRRRCRCRCRARRWRWRRGRPGGLRRARRPPPRRRW